MINNKEDLHLYISEDAKANGYHYPFNFKTRLTYFLTQDSDTTYY